MKKIGIQHGGLLWAVVWSVWGCAAQLPALVETTQVTGNPVVGRVVTVLTGETTRRYLPEMRFFELEDQASQKRFQVKIESYDRYFTVDLPTGNYRLNRVQIREGPFMSMAELAMTFSVAPGVVNYVGTWRFGIGTPRAIRELVTSVIADQAEATGARDFLKERYPSFSESSMVEKIPQPSQMETRLYEVRPYPRYRQLFCRHLC